MDLTNALSALPHGSEFRFVDSLTDLEPGVFGQGVCRVRGDELFLRGHFPGNPVFPGVLLVEACAQLAGVVAQCDPKVAPLRDLKLTAVRGVKILGSAQPGEVICLQARITGRMGHLVDAEVTASVAGTLVLKGAVTLAGAAP